MIACARFAGGAFAVLVSWSGAGFAEDEAYRWLERINQAASTLNYDGIFVYQHGDRLQTLRVVHKVQNGHVQERLVTLTGEPREVIRNDSEVRCYLPDQKSVVIQHRQTGGRSFPAILPERPRVLAENYVIELGQIERVVGRAAQGVLIKPRDDYRYGHQLWADRESGLLLRAELIDDGGKIVEQFMFTAIAIGVDIPPEALASQTAASAQAWHRESQAGLVSLTQKWRALRVPKGFRLSMSLTRTKTARGPAVEQLVYTDGLAAVSVFVEKRKPGTASPVGAPRRMGALSVLGKPVNNYSMTIVGEVPTKTVSLIGDSIVPVAH